MRLLPENIKWLALFVHKGYFSQSFYFCSKFLSNFDSESKLPKSRFSQEVRAIFCSFGLCSTCAFDWFISKVTIRFSSVPFVAEFSNYKEFVVMNTLLFFSLFLSARTNLAGKSGCAMFCFITLKMKILFCINRNIFILQKIIKVA